MQDDEVRQRIGVKRNIKERSRKRQHRAKLRHFHERQRTFYQRYIRPKQIYADSQAPETFSILTNRAETVAYLKHVDKNLKDRIYTSMNLSSVEATDLATICLLSGYMLDSRTKSQFLEVKIPPRWKLTPSHMGRGRVRQDDH